MFNINRIKTLIKNFTDERLQSVRLRTSERGRRGTEASQLRMLYAYQQPDYEQKAVIDEIRRMDRESGVVKQMHNRIAKALTKGGLILDNPKNDEQLEKLWADFARRTQLKKRLKLISDARGLIVEGSLPLQWVLDDNQKKVMRAVRMPTESIRAIVGIDGQFKDPKAAYAQYDYLEGRDLAVFARWQLDVARLDPDNFDDMGSFGRPLLDAVRKKWRQMEGGQEDMFIRRRTRAAMRTAHSLEGATPEELAEYKRQVESEEGDQTNNYYMNKKGAVAALQGDENLDQVGDIALLMDSFFAGSPMPKSMLGYVEGLTRDVLEDMKKEFYDELDTLQDSIADCYDFGFRLELLLNGINPDSKKFEIRYGERMTESPTQKTDRALKVMALGASRQTAWTIAGLNHADELERLEDERANLDAYPINELGIPGVDDEMEAAADRGQKISITPNQGGGNNSATSISN